MKKSKIFTAAASLILAATAIMASKANNKRFVHSFSTAITLGNAVRVIAPTNVFTTANTGHQAYLIGGTQEWYRNLYTVVNRVKAAYLK